MTDDPLQAVRELEREITERLSATRATRDIVQLAELDAAALRQHGVLDAEQARRQRVQELLASAGRRAAEIKSTGDERVQLLRSAAATAREDDVTAVQADTLPDLAGYRAV
ncbi:MAG: hypothetical protein LH624_15495 [Cryobacterium sp.]|nr:hypothetical protein [Cryobacterium sp.]